MIELTSSGPAPWHLIEANDMSYRRVKTMRILLDSMRGAAANTVSAAPAPEADAGMPTDLRERARNIEVGIPSGVLDSIDLSKKLSREEYELRLDPIQEKLRDLAFE
jgi:hypothetical protein